MSQKKYVSLARLSDFLANIKAKYSQIGHKHTTADITDYVVDTQFSSTSNNPIANKTVDAEFEAISQAMNALESFIDDKADTTHNHDSAYDVKGAAAESLASSKSYTDTKTSGLASTTSVNNSISTHNTSTSAHNDIRVLITDLTTKLNNFLDVDDTTTDQLSEVITLINNNKGTLESITTNKINVSDIIDNLTTASVNKVLSANQGVVIKSLIDDLEERLNGLQGAVEETVTSDYVDGIFTEIWTAVDGKADTEHGHEISDITNLQTVLDGKASSTHSHTMPTYDLASSKSSTNGNVKLNLTAGGSASGTDSITIVGSGATTVTTDASGIVTIKGTNTTYSAITNEEIDEICANTYTSMLNAIAAEGVSF